MDDAEGGVRSKHLKPRLGASGDGPELAATPARLRTAVARRLAGYGLPAAGVSGAGAWLTAVSTHRVSAAAMVASAVMVTVTVVAHYVAKCVDSYFQHRAPAIGAQGPADEVRIRAQAAADASRARDDLRQKAFDEPEKAPIVERMQNSQDLVKLAAQCGLTGEQFYDFAAMLLREQPPPRPKQNPPGSSGKRPRGACPQARTSRPRYVPLGEPPTHI